MLQQQRLNTSKTLLHKVEAPQCLVSEENTFVLSSEDWHKWSESPQMKSSNDFFSTRLNPLLRKVTMLGIVAWNVVTL